MPVDRIAFKSGVWTDPLSLIRISPALHVAALTAPDLVDGILMVTSLRDGTHGRRSLHYVGEAADLRTEGDRPGAIVAATDEERQVIASKWVIRMRDMLGESFDVLYHGRGANRHVHIEHDPRR